jgi:large subunit ribosomal protein L22e
MVKKKGAPQRQAKIEFRIDCSLPVEDQVFGLPNFEKFLNDRIKVEGKRNNLNN